MRRIMLAIAGATLAIPALPSTALAGDGYYKGRVWRDSHGRLRCKRPNGTTGLIVGGAAGALVGREIARDGGRHRYRRGGGSGTVGAIIGGAVGALVGREIDRGC